jgi:hypothetical protein
MKLAFPHYEGDGIIRPFITPISRAAVKLAKPAEVLRRNITAADSAPTIKNGLELEFQARALRRQYLREWIKGVLGGRDD